jgi:hypothetical protein
VRLSPALFFGAFFVLAACSSGDDPDAAPDDPTNGGRADGGRSDGDVDPTGDGGGSGEPATCTMDAPANPTVEEQRLENKLPGKSVAFATELLQGTGFDVFEKTFAEELCKNGIAGASTFDDAKTLVATSGRKLWQAAVGRVQGTRPSGTLPAGDDRMLYWARLTMTKTLRTWNPSFGLNAQQRGDLEWELERASRGQDDIKLPAGSGYVRIVISGFDPFTLGDPGTTSVNIRIGNPSGASALALDGIEFALPSGKTAHIETFVLPVNYGPFERGMQEDALGPWLQPGPSRADIAITMSQGSGFRFKLEEYNGRFHGEFEGNDGIATCSGATLLASTPGCSINPPKKWVGYESLPWTKDKPPQFVESTLPIAAMINANTGAQVTRPPDSQASAGNAFDVVWGYDYETFPDCNQSATQLFYSPVSTTYPPPGSPQPPSATSCARSGSGGDYLSNESAYRATLLRDALNLTIPAGHIHTPVMSRFQTGNDGAITDAKYEAYRTAIVQQGRLLIEAVAKSL